jgi:hypothetical protein
MKSRIYMLAMLTAFVSIFAVNSASAQRGGRGHSSFGGPRVSVGVGVGVGRGFYGGGGYYHSPRYYAPHYYYAPRYHYRPYYYGPPIGFRVGVLPYGFLTFNTGWGPYYYYDGLFYRPVQDQTSSEQYQVADPPMGVVIPHLPKGAKEVEIDGNTYYEKNGTLYQEVQQDNTTKYVVVGKNGQLDGAEDDAQPQDQVYAQLPDGSRGVEINGQQLYVSPDGMYYQEITNPDNSRGYKIVGKMSADQ